MSNFTGRYRYSLDDKNRVNIPAKYRKLLTPEAQEMFAVTRGIEECLYVYPFDEWQRLIARLRGLPMNKADNRDFQRKLASLADEMKYDRQGRIILPPWLLEHAKIKKDVIILGVLDRIEIWDPQTYEEFDQSRKPFEEVAENILFDNPDTRKEE